MLPDFVTVLIVVAAAFVRATFDFGDALLAMPLLALTIGLGAATPLVGLVSFSTAVVMLFLLWRAVDVRAVLPLLAVAAVGIPLGVIFLKRAPSAWSLGALGVFLIGFGVYRLLSPHLPDIKHPALTFFLGLLSGLFGGAYNTSGPFAVLYGSLRGWPPETFRASLQGYFTVTSALILVSQGLGGLWTAHVWRLYGFSLPLTVVAIVTGNILAKRLSPARFERLLDAALVVLGLTLLL